MPSKIEPRTLKGFKDYLPEEQRLRQKIMDTCREVFELYGFLPLDTPALEYLDVLTKKYGEDEKLIYSFEDRGGRMVGMRYDLTVPLARVVAQYQNELKFPFKRYQIASSWRAENPQKGRYREFIQADADIVGVESLSADAECVAMYSEILRRLQIKNFKISINTREVFNGLGEILGMSADKLAGIVRIIDKLDKVGIDKLTDLLSELGLTGDQVAAVQAYLATAQSEQVLDNMDEFFKGSREGRAAVKKLRQINDYLKVLGVPEEDYQFDPSIARGLDYYTGTVFEVRVAKSSVGSIGGAGRYDQLVEQFLNKKIPAVGMSVGVDRLLALLLEQGMETTRYTLQVTRVLVMNLGQDFAAPSLDILKDLRGAGISAEYFYDAKDLDKQFKYAESQGIPYAILIGDDEISTKTVTLRNLQTRAQESVARSQVVARLNA